MTAAPRSPADTATSIRRDVIQNVQVLRFLAAGGVLISHTADLLISKHSLFWVVPWTSGVDIFFVISGFIMTCLSRGRFGTPGAPRAFLVRRLIRIAPPYWLFTTLMICVVLLLGEHARHTSVDPAQVVTSYSFLPWPRADGKLNPILSQGWTLNYEAFFYLAFAAALAFRNGLRLLAAAFVLLAGLHPWIPPAMFMLRFWSDSIILEFLAGAILALIYLSGRRIRWWGSILCIAAGISVFIVTRGPLEWMHWRILHLGVPAFLICASLILAPEPERIGWAGRALQLGGDASYTIYLSHTFSIGAVVLLWRRLGPDLPWLGVAVAMSVAIAVAILFFRFVERPMTDGLQRRFGFKASRGAAEVAP
jgi:exopolysaccharide production protein ExoZ